MYTKGNCFIKLFFLLFIIPVAYGNNASLYSITPPQITDRQSPLVMLVLSVDHELFKKAYSDYSDLNDDGLLDTSYKDHFEYVGYFNSNLCYRYNVNDGVYEPKGQAQGDFKHFCNHLSGSWSGNFLNWATMTRVDILRKVLYGGKRVIDNMSDTVLERSYLPMDVHAFSKKYQGSNDIPVSYLTPFNVQSITLCNVSTSEDGDPVVRVANGIWNRWSATEIRQCQWDYDNSPSLNYKLAENRLFIKRCSSIFEIGKDSTCRQYGSGNFKPIGILQKYSEEKNIQFGLLTGSYDKNTAGGLLRKNIKPMINNSNKNSDEYDLSSGIFNPNLNGIIAHINNFRIAQYSFARAVYLDCDSPGIDSATFNNNTSRATRSRRHCSNWGNPLAEIYTEALRYFSGNTFPSNIYDTDSDSYFLPNLATVQWNTPQNADNACASCSIIVLSTGVNSFDRDQLSPAQQITGISSRSKLDDLTNQVGSLESKTNEMVNFPGYYLADRAGGDKVCENTFITSLSQVSGICPEAPQLDGGYDIAGLSWYAKTNDLRTDLEGFQNVTTYVVQLADSLPSFTLDVGGNQFSFQPICMASSNRSACSLTDIIVDEFDDHAQKGKFTFYWEDSLWGNDYDYDAGSSIIFCIGISCNPAIGATQVQLTVQQEAKNSGVPMWYSYTVTGTSQDGIVLPLAEDNGAATSQGAGVPVTTIFNTTNQAAFLLPKPLWFAAKYGGFVDVDNDGTPQHESGDTREWDIKNNYIDRLGKDGIPDNLFLANNPSRLEFQIERIMGDISNRVSAIASVSLIASKYTGQGVVYQALLQPKLESMGHSISWIGKLQALFLDNAGWMREDTNGNKKLDGYDQDYAVKIFLDERSGNTLFQRYIIENEKLVPKDSLMPFEKIASVWDAHSILSDITVVSEQKNYTSSALQGRYIKTWLDYNGNYKVDVNEFVDFTPESFKLGMESLLQVNTSDIINLINYIRGEDIAGFRSRTISFSNENIEKVWRLGDIVHSSPVVLGAPSSDYYARYGDLSYKNFMDHYKDRRQVVFIGANDGMLHAFNGGFWNSTEHSFSLTGHKNEVAYPLGAELWGYVPMNLLGHLRWLTQPDYAHVYYMDGSIQLFDVNIFPNDEDHPGGWGTILVAAMGLGGGTMDFELNGQNYQTNSAYVVMDVTNPEKPPTLLAEITHLDLGFTTSKPALIKGRKAQSSDWSNIVDNNWYLILGAGPHAKDTVNISQVLHYGTTNQALKLFLFDLKTMNFVDQNPAIMAALNNTYSGDLVSKDWDNDFIDDAVYAGYVQTVSNQLSGGLLKVYVDDLENGLTFFNILNAGAPIVATPLLLEDSFGNYIYAGTGRFMHSVDNYNFLENYFFGIKEYKNQTPLTLTKENLVNTTQYRVNQTGHLWQEMESNQGSVMIDGYSINDFESLKTVMRSKSGWFIDLPNKLTNQQGERSISPAINLYSMILFTTYQPPQDICLIDGDSYLYGLHYITGTSMPSNFFSDQLTDHTNTINDDNIQSKRHLGKGFVSKPIIHYGDNGELFGIIQGGGGDIKSFKLEDGYISFGRQSWKLIDDF